MLRRLVGQAGVDQRQPGVPGLWPAEYDPQDRAAWSDATLMN
jgi:hypothetical protein